MPRSSIVVLAIDGLRASALGAYGNTWYETPALDRIASDSLVCDWVFADTQQTPSIYRGLWSGLAPWEAGAPNAASLPLVMEREGFEAVLVADDELVGQAPGADHFTRRLLVEPPPRPEAPVSEAADTASARTLALWLDELEQCPAGRPLLAWCHLSFARGGWDAPLGPAELMLGEHDPRPRATTAPPSGAVDDAKDPEFAFESTVRYAAQVMALDRCLGVVATAFDELLGPGSYGLAVLGVRGFALGEHGRVGIDDYRPYGEARHVPLLIRPPDGARRCRRCQALRTTGNLASALSSTLRAPELRATEAAREIVLASPSGAAIQTEHWKLIAWDDGRRELYSKPDDRWEINDVAVREPLVVEELEGLLRERTGGGSAS